MSARDAVLRRTGSHHIDDTNYSSRADGISKEEVFLYFDAVWRGQPVQVDVSADRYAHSSGMSDWRVYARDARFYDAERNGGRGEPTTQTARSALSALCVPLAVEWLATDAYRESFKTALAHMIMRKFRENYGATSGVTDALATFGERLSPEVRDAIKDTLDARIAYEARKDRACDLIKGGATC